ncbi:MAG: prolyl oligopeptidase family serine peptidase [Armatimonadia bacterium]|nr:prolyl oligopeptidase family serine peptidase [Armatimonadia bacterium]
MDGNELQDFWAEVRRELDAVPIEAETERVEPEPDRLVQTWRVTLTGLGGVRFSACLTLPDLGREARPLPAVMYTPGYGGDTPHTVMSGLCYDKGIAVLTVYPRGQGESKLHWTVPEGQTKLTMGLDDARDQYYRAGYADCLRGIDYLSSHEEIDAERIGVIGLSQGGGLTLATAALDPRVKCAVAHEPFLCNYPVAVETATTGPYLELINLFAERPDIRDRALETLAWFDPVNLARLITCPTFISIGLADTTCPAETIRPVYEQIGALRGLIEIPDAGHGWHYVYRDFDDLWLRRHL